MNAIGPDLLGRLYDAHASALILYARQWCDAPGAEDVVQEAFMSLARQRRAPDHTLAWLYRAVRNSAITWSRGRSRRRRRETLVAQHEAWFSAADDQLDAQEATRMLAELPSDCREAIVARLWGGLTFDEIARLHGCSIAMTHRRYREGLALLQERLNQTWLESTLKALRI
jgi:RNA polymerase sigma-70 factor (ECF subfamily)